MMFSSSADMQNEAEQVPGHEIQLCNPIAGIRERAEPLLL